MSMLGLAVEWSVFQPGRTVIDCSDGTTLVMVVRGKLKIKPVRGRTRIDATPFLPVSLQAQPYVIENKSYSIAMICRRAGR